MPDFLPTAPLEHLRQRAELLRRVRAFFDRRGFWEVETPLLSADTVVDRYLDPVPVTLYDDPRDPDRGPRMWLQTSPEFGMKRLLVAGATAIYQLARAVRAGERGVWHNPEFTMLEWYRVGDDLDRGMDLLDELAQEFLPGGPAERVTYRQAFREHLGIDPLTASAEQLVQSVREQGIPIPESLPADDRDGWLDLLLTERVQPHLGRARATILYDYPASQAALARIRDDDPPVAERFELFVDGTEVANGYHELLDAEALSARNQEHNRHRVADGRFALPEHSRLLQAMRQGLPPCAGVALGFDRLLMLRLGATDISAVMAFPIERA